MDNKGIKGEVSKELVLFIILIIVIGGVIFWVNRSDKTTDTSAKETTTEEVQDENGESEKVEGEAPKEETEKEENEVDFSKLSDSEKLGSDGLPILMYHFFYDKTKGETAKDGNWLEVATFEEHLNYLEENDFYFPTWQQVADYVNGKIDLPKKSVVLTVDDGEESFFKVALPVIEKYDIKLTQFLVTSWNGWFKNDYPAKQVTYQSHSDNMHKAGADGRGAIVNWSYSEVLNDLKTSRSVLGDECIAFCYPFGHYNDNAKKAVKEAGFKIAVTTEGGRAKKGSDPYALPRVRTSSSTTLEVFKGLVN